MSKVSVAKFNQQYREKAGTCSNCEHRKSDLVLPAWMKDQNRKEVEAGRNPIYGSKHCLDKNQRCSIGGFAVKKMATCGLWKELK